MGITDDALGIRIYCQRRSAGKASDLGTLRITNKQRVASRGVEKTGLTSQQIADAESQYRGAQDAVTNGHALNFPDRIYRQHRERPLLIIHLLAIGSENDDLSAEKPVVAYGISFPDTATEERRVEYVVNTTWLRENYRDDIEEEEMAGDVD